MTSAPHKKKMKDGDDYSAAGFFRQGECFLFTGRYLNSFFNQYIDLATPMLMSIVSTIAVNSAFGTECYLKSLLILENGKFRSSHDLHRLFLDLPNRVRNSIAINWTNPMPSWQRQTLEELSGEQAQGGWTPARGPR